MSYEIRKPHDPVGLTPSERRALTYQKEPVETLANLWEKYPEGGLPGWHCLIKSLHALYAWDENINNWTELGKGLVKDKHDKKTGMLLRLLPPGTYSEKDHITLGEVIILPLDSGDFTLYNNTYIPKKQIISVTEKEVGQVVLSGQGKQWEKLTLPIYDYLREKLENLENNRGIVTQNPNELNFHPAPQPRNYVYFKDTEDEYPFLWTYTGKIWEKTTITMPSAKLTPLSEYARHGYTTDKHIKTLAQIETMVENLSDAYRTLNDNVDGGNAFSGYGGCRGINGGNAFTKYDE